MRFFISCLLNIFFVVGFTQNLPKDSWKIVDVDSEEKNEDVKGSGLASCIIDNNINTFWTTGFKTERTHFPHHVVIDLGAIANLNGFIFYPRQKRYQCRISSYRIYVGLDSLHWKLIREGTFNWKNYYDYSPQAITLKKKVDARYIKLEVLKPFLMSDNCIHLAEIDIHGAYLAPFFIPRIRLKKDTIIANEFAEFVDSSFFNSTAKIQSREWHFPGGIPSASSERTVKVYYKNYGRYNVSLTIRSKEGIKKTIFLKNIVTHLPAPAIRRSDWKISVSEQECTLVHDTATNIIDDDPMTMWHTAWFMGKKLPHFVLVDLGRKTKIHGIGYLPRQVGKVNGIFSSYRVFISNDTLDFGNEICHVVKSEPYRNVCITAFPPTTGRYLKIIIDKTFPFNHHFASASELYIYGEPASTSVTPAIIISLIVLLFLMWIIIRKVKKKKTMDTVISLNNTLSSEKPLKLYLFGKFQIMNKEQPIQLFNKIKQVLGLITYYTIENNGIGTSELSRFLWSDLPDENVSNARSSNIKKLRTALHDVSGIQIIIEDKLWKTHSPEDNLYIDFKVYKELYASLSDATFFDEDKVNHFLDIVERGRLLEDVETDWADNIKNKISEEIINILRKLLTNYPDKLSSQMIIRISDCLFLQDELNVEALRAKIKLYCVESNLGLAKKTYDAYCRKYRLIYREDFPTEFTDFIQ